MHQYNMGPNAVFSGIALISIRAAAFHYMSSLALFYGGVKAYPYKSSLLKHIVYFRAKHNHSPDALFLWNLQ